MAKLLKHFGIGGKKTPPHPPKPDYSAPKSSSVQELLTKSPTRDRSTLSLATGSSHTSDFDTASLTDSPHHRSHHSLAERVGFGGARPKEPRNLSPKSSTLGSERRSTAPCAFPTEEDGSFGGGADGEVTEESPKAKPKPQLLDVYSDPLDVRKQIENPELLGACASNTPGVTDDDYSVPYEVKKLIREMKQSEGEGDAGASPGGSRKDPSATYDDPFDSNQPSDRFSSASRDRRPREDYDEPWEWAARQNALLQAQMENTATQGPQSSPQQQNKTPLMTPIRTPKQVSPGKSAEAGVESEGLSNHCGGGGEDGVMEDEETVLVVQNGPKPPSASEATEAEDDGYTHLCKEPGSAVLVDGNPLSHPTGQQSKDTRVGNYEEPWDLSFTQQNLEDKIKAASITGVHQGGATASAEASKDPPGGHHKSDSRPMEGYEKPWDWKPHRKDDRGQEGYEKPWDWKPHQKDDRPGEEYEEPWDNKNKAIEEMTMAATGEMPPGGGGVVGATPSAGKSDDRPSEEYEEPWDQRRSKAFLARTGSDGSAGSGPSQSPARKQRPNLDLAWSGAMVGEIVDPKLPLDQQGWYHGSISRVDAEALLRVHKEGSYLVRMSESNKLDFSLSLKSARGFMHMKITSRDGRFILGQFSQPFASIPLMIHHYSISKLPIKGAEHMSLLHPINHEELL